MKRNVISVLVDYSPLEKGRRLTAWGPHDSLIFYRWLSNLLSGKTEFSNGIVERALWVFAVGVGRPER